ncbi:hypothetical protein G6F55_009662 [Rhizopus delemar]|uniref:60S ribosomal protein L37 n=2 Tax=Rhizopus TaxID=4842 RepID=A0A9P7CLM1_9FUNG|nr:hypothetical protein G6F55_009662 [Rhizopus delemar]KAG1528985.1 hypothetical protein G6F52_000157 [Rhizopus delemar]KAG1540099.1 hypothetical protein G6F51_008725 [Rhizopus arrhizus]KAG1567356.1 hypothetical protein G6F50_008282 [Rhizopus delemar]KAG1630692.1 hypothetical protein G6F45_005319 [Rhizopus arrhizus]
MIWIRLIDRHPHLHGVLTGLLTAIGTLGILLVLSIPPLWTVFILPAAIVSCVLDGLFFQPIEVVIDSAIVKILGEYKILYGHERKWGKYTSALMTLAIAYFLKDDHDFDTLIVILLVGSVALFLLSLSTNVQSADPTLLLGRQVQQQQPLLNSEIVYRPYHLFGEHLSHISEEDASMLQRMTTTHSKLIDTTSSITDEYPSFELARLPYPPISCFIVSLSFFYYTEQEEEEEEKRKEKGILYCLFFLGIVFGMTQPFMYLVLYDTFKVSMPIIGLVGFMSIMSPLLADHLFTHLQCWIKMTTVLSFLGLLLSCLAFMFLIPDTISTQIIVVLLQLCQGLSFQLIWLSAIHQVNTMLFTDDKRMVLKGSMSMAYNYLGFAMGMMASSYLLSNQVYTSIYQYSIPFTLASALTKGTSSFGKRHTKSHTLCRRCGNRAFHKQKKTCAQCGYPAAKIRSFNWSEKGKRRKTTGTGRMAHLKEVHRRFKNGFREGSQAKKQVAASA